ASLLPRRRHEGRQKMTRTEPLERRWVEPFYTVKLTAYGCRYDVRLNDAPLYEDQEGDSAGLEIPANEWLRDGENTLSFYLQPLPGEADFDKRTDVEAILYVREMGQAKEQRQELMRLTYVHAEQSDEAAAPQPLRFFEKAFTLRLPFAPWRWFQ